jgi:hypothetical protein
MSKKMKKRKNRRKTTRNGRLLRITFRLMYAYKVVAKWPSFLEDESSPAVLCAIQHVRRPVAA